MWQRSGGTPATIAPSVPLLSPSAPSQSPLKSDRYVPRALSVGTTGIAINTVGTPTSPFGRHHLAILEDEYPLHAYPRISFLSCETYSYYTGLAGLNQPVSCEWLTSRTPASTRGWTPHVSSYPGVDIHGTHHDCSLGLLRWHPDSVLRLHCTKPSLEAVAGKGWAAPMIWMLQAACDGSAKTYLLYPPTMVGINKNVPRMAPSVTRSWISHGLLPRILGSELRPALSVSSTSNTSIPCFVRAPLRHTGNRNLLARFFSTLQVCCTGNIDVEESYPALNSSLARLRKPEY